MNARLLSQVVESPVLAKLLLLTCIASLFLYLRRKDTESHSGAFLALIGILLVRDVLSAFYLSPELFFLSDVFYLGFALFILMVPYENSRLVLILSLGFNVLVASAFVGGVVVGLLPALPSKAFGYLLVADALIAGLTSFMNRKDRGNSERQLVSALWPSASILLLAYASLALVMGYDNYLFLGLVMPLSYGWLLMAAFFALGIQETKLVSALDYYEAAIDSLYAMFLSTGTSLKSNYSAAEVLNNLNEIMKSETGADGAVILMVDGEGHAVVRAYSGFFPPPVLLVEKIASTDGGTESYMRQARFRLGEGIFGDVAKTGKNVYIPNAAGDSRIAMNGDIPFLRIRSFMAVPLMVEDRIVGVSALVRTAKEQAFEEADFDRFKLLANFGTLAIGTQFSYVDARERSGDGGAANGAAEILRSITPRQLPQHSKFSIDALSLPGTDGNGVYYDVMHRGKHRLVGVIAEVDGKGVQAALVMVMIRSILQVLVKTDKDMAAVLNWINKSLCGGSEAGHTASLGLVSFDTTTGELEYASAGCQGVLVYRNVGKDVDSIYKASLPIGGDMGTEYERISLRLHPRDALVLFSKGVDENTDGQGRLSGRKELARLVSEHGHLDAADIVASIRAGLSAHDGTVRHSSDRTMLVFKVN